MLQITAIKFAFQSNQPIAGFCTLADRTWAVVDGKRKPIDANPTNVPLTTTATTITLNHPTLQCTFDLAPFKAQINALFTAAPERSGKDKQGGSWQMSPAVTIDEYDLNLWSFTAADGTKRHMFQMQPRSMTLPSSTQMA